jgi:hypothetical protein
MSSGGDEVTVGYKYFVGMHLALCHGPVDALKRIRVDNKTAWEGEHTGGTLALDAQHLFGGKKREGGVKGNLDFETGAIDQPQNAYLLAQLGEYVPAFRRIAAAVLNQMYVGLNPYLKTWEFRVQRIHTIQDGTLQWYDAKAAISVYRVVVPPSYGNWKYKVLALADSTDYSSPSVDDSSWPEGPAPFADQYWSYPANFGFSATPATVVPEARRVWMRTRIWLSAVPSQFKFEAFIDNEMNLYVNGTFVKNDGAYNGHYSSYYISSAAFVEGWNDIAVVCWDWHSGPGNFFYFDWRLINEEITLFDLNPAHLIRECITDPDWGMGYGAADIDEAAFTAAADTLYAEGFGLSLLWDRQTAIEDFLAEVVRTIDAVLYVDIASGLWVLKLIREDYDAGSLPVLNTSNVERIEHFSRPSFGELVNQVTVKYWDSAASQDSAVTVTDDALVQMQGQLIGQTNAYSGITNQAIAVKAARRDLQALSKPLASCVLYGQRSVGDLREGDAFKLTWPDYGLENGLILRVVQIGYGDARDGRVRIRATEDAFSTPYFSTDTTAGSDWSSPISEPIAITHRLVVEAPYYQMIRKLGQAEADARLGNNPDLGYLMATGESPTPDALNALIATDAGAGYTEYGAVDFCPVAVLDADLPQEQGPSTVAITGGVDLDEVTLGTVAQIDDELVRVDAVSDTSVTLGRGVLDTTPAPHSTGAVVFFWGGYTGSDNVDYVTSDAVDVKLLTVTGSGQLAQAAAPVDTVILNARANRPYPPGALTIDGAEYPASAEYTLTLTWAHRDRGLQSDQLTGSDEAGIGPEAGVTYTLRGYTDDVLMGEITGVDAETYDFGWAGNGTGRLEVWADRGGIESWQALWAEFAYTGNIGMTYVNWAVGTDYDNTPAVLGGTPPYAFALTAGAIPGTWTFDTATGQLYGPALTTEATYDFTVEITDSTTPTPNVSEAPQSLTVYQNPNWSLVTWQHRGQLSIGDDKGSGWTNSGVTATADQILWGTGSLKFNAGNSLYRSRNAAKDNCGTNDWTLEAWIYPTSLTGSSVYGTIYSDRASGADFNRCLYHSSGYPHFTYGQLGGTARIDMGTSTYPVNLNAWNHIAATRSNGYIYLLCNGVVCNRRAETASIRQNGSTVYIGKSLSYGDSYFKGHMYQRATLGVDEYCGGIPETGDLYSVPTIPFPNA